MHPADTSYSKYWQLFTALHSAITQKIHIFAFHLSEFMDGKMLNSMSGRKTPTNHTTIDIYYITSHSFTGFLWLSKGHQ